MEAGGYGGGDQRPQQRWQSETGGGRPGVRRPRTRVPCPAKATGPLLRQMPFIDGGIARLIEHWVEQFHQVGRRYNLSYCRAGSLEKQEEFCSKLERRGRHPRVRMDKKRLEDVKKKHRYRHKRQQERKAIELFGRDGAMLTCLLIMHAVMKRRRLLQKSRYDVKWRRRWTQFVLRT